MTREGSGHRELLQGGAAFLAGRVAAALLGLLVIAVVTRRFPPAAYGQLALAMSLAGACTTVLYLWLRQGLLRLGVDVSPDARSRTHHAVLRVTRRLWLGTAMITTLLVTGALLGAVPSWVAGAGLLALVIGPYEVALDFLRIGHRAARYAAIQAVRAALWCVLAVAASTVAASGEALIVAAVLAYLLPLATLWRPIVRQASLAGSAGGTAALVRHGGWVAVSASLDQATFALDRLMVEAMLGRVMLGPYASGLDVVRGSVGSLFGVINLSLYVRTVEAFDAGAEARARTLLCWAACSIAGLGILAALAAFALGGLITTLIVGPEFRQVLARVLPVILLAYTLYGLKVFVLDVHMQLHRRPEGQVVGSLAAMVVLALAGFAWIPSGGALGAAWATVAAWATGALVGLTVNLLWCRGPAARTATDPMPRW